MRQTDRKYASIFELDGIPRFSHALPLAIQHLVAMIVGCVTPPIIVSNIVGLEASERVILIQAALVVSALSTLLQLSIGKKKGFHLGASLPVILGISFAYVPSMQSIAADYGISAILGAQIVGGIVAFLVGISVMRIRKFFPPLITGTVVFTIGLSLYPTAINYMAGGVSSPSYGSWQNWTVAFITLTVVTVLNHFGKGIYKLASILIGIIVGYVTALFFGMVSFSNIAAASLFSIPRPLHFGIVFEPSSCIAIGLLFAINSVQAIGDFTATTSGSIDREPTDKELQGGIMGYGVTNILGALLGGLPTATYSQNVGIVTTTKVVNRCVMGLTAVFFAGCRSDSQVFCFAYHHSPVCVRRCYCICICLHSHDGYETGHFRRDELSEFFHRRTCCCTWNGNIPGYSCSFYISSLGSHYLWPFSCGCCNISSNLLKYYFA